MPLDRTEFRGTSRYELTSVLGAGGMGVVYEAFDCEINSPVALKYLPSTSPRAYLRFKREFRSLRDLHHDNLVRLGELVADDSHVFFTMELVDGTDLLSFCRRAEDGRPKRALGELGSIGVDDRTLDGDILESPSVDRAPPPSSVDEGRVRAAFAQLVRGLHALHATGKIHRDIKPANVLVTRVGRVVILDCGVTAGASDDDGELDHGVIGSVAYMAPEQASGGAISASTDFYAVGTMLFQVLSGALPFQGTPAEILQQKRSGVACALPLGPGVPGDLDGLCRELLDLRPSRRPAAAEILSVLEGGPASRIPSASLRPFIGREPELARLERAYQRASAGQASALHVEGVSGSGKSRLLETYLSDVRARPGTLVLTGRCSVRESVPFKAIDSVVDELSAFLARTSARAAADAVPEPLLRAFPGLTRVLRSAPTAVGAEPADPYAQRRALFGAFRAFFESACHGLSVVIAIDDVQWADADSWALLAALLNPAPRLPLLFLTAGRESSERSVRRVVGGELLELGSLSHRDSVTLAGSLLARSRAASADLAERIAQEAEGHPFLIEALVQEAGHEAGRFAGAGRLDAALSARVERLEPRRRRMVQLAALAAGPLPLRVLVAASESSHPLSTSIFLDLQALQNDHLLRLDGDWGSSRIELYHDRIGAAVRANLAAREETHLHACLASALEREPSCDRGELALHYFGAGEGERAASHALAAAGLADRTLAFERAARLYAMALEYWPHLRNASEVREKLGDALTNAGLGARAAQAYIAASQDAGEERRLELERRAADQLFRSGHVDAAAPLIQRVLRPLGLRLPRSSFWSLAVLLWTRLRLSLRRLNRPLYPEGEVDPRRLRSLNACWSVAVGLAMVDNVRGAGLQTQHLILALDLGQPTPLLRALCAEAGYVAVSGRKARKRVERLLARADEVARQVSDPTALALQSLLRAMCAFLMGQWSTARELGSAAERVFAARPTGATWELANARTFRLWSDFYLGDFGSMRAQAEEFTREAEARGDLYAATIYRTGLLVTPWLASDEPDLARERLAAAELGWSRSSFDFQRYLATLAHCLIDLYQGAPELAYRRFCELWPGLSRSLYLRIQSLRVEALYFRAVAATGAASRSAHAPRLLREARRVAARLEREQTSASLVFSALLRAGIVEVEGRGDVRQAWLRAEQLARRHGMQMFADSAALCAARHERGLEPSPARVQPAPPARHPQVRDARRFCRMLVPTSAREGADWLEP
jgi:serine/threonine protein kinase